MSSILLEKCSLTVAVMTLGGNKLFKLRSWVRQSVLLFWRRVILHPAQADWHRMKKMKTRRLFHCITTTVRGRTHYKYQLSHRPTSISEVSVCHITWHWQSPVIMSSSLSVLSPSQHPQKYQHLKILFKIQIMTIIMSWYISGSAKLREFCKFFS